MKVVKALETGTLDDGRKAVSMIVGRDTEHLSEEEVLKAAVETVAENASDGILAPLLFAAVLGPVGGMCYKAVNTMDSMVGYKNDRYLDFGRAAAKVDDVLNFLPARISGFLMCLAACCGFDGKNAFRIFFRDRKNHASPNSAHTEAACAGALGLKLGGTHDYFGKPVVKPPSATICVPCAGATWRRPTAWRFSRPSWRSCSLTFCPFWQFGGFLDGKSPTAAT